MVKLINLLKEITEGKQVGTLYHYTDIKRNGVQVLYNIIKQNTLIPSNGSDKVSLTRSKNQDFTLAQGRSVIVLDGDKLSNNYKITPYHDIEWNYDIQDIEPEDRDKKIPPIDRFQRDFFEDEQEETINGPITNLNKYIIKVIIYVDNKDEYQNNPELLQDINQLINLLKEKNIPYEIKNNLLYPNKVWANLNYNDDDD